MLKRLKHSFKDHIFLSNYENFNHIRRFSRNQSSPNYSLPFCKFQFLNFFNFGIKLIELIVLHIAPMAKWKFTAIIWKIRVNKRYTSACSDSHDAIECNWTFYVAAQIIHEPLSIQVSLSKQNQTNHNIKKTSFLAK